MMQMYKLVCFILVIKEIHATRASILTNELRAFLLTLHFSLLFGSRVLVQVGNKHDNTI